MLKSSRAEGTCWRQAIVGVYSARSHDFGFKIGFHGVAPFFEGEGGRGCLSGKD